jgi:hypothetical protein
MKRTGGGMHQNNGISGVIEFIRENALAKEIDDTPVITSKGERFLQALGEAAAQSNSGLTGAL